MVFEEQSLSYGELNARANQLAHYLRSMVVGPDRLVAICVERSLEMVVGLLAVLKAGGAYVPLDPAYPGERLAYMLRDSSPDVVLTHGPARAALDAALKHAGGLAPVLELDAGVGQWADQPTHNPDPHEVGLTARHLAYVIYTSGSTGNPKGVMVEHAGVVNLALAQGLAFGVTRQSRVSQFSSFSFDATVSEVVMALGHGASLHLGVRGTVMAGDALVDAIRRHRVTHLTVTPLVLSAIADSSGLDGVEALIVAGEASTGGLVKRWGAGRRLFNAYGPTEATVCATIYGCDASIDEAAIVPIGRPIANVDLCLLDEAGEPVPAGEVGEIHIGGAGVARGYLNRPELTAERFIASTLVPGGRLYKTGDLGRWLPDGNLEYLGRNDFQVKIRGFRIELGEIEARLADCEGVREAVVLAREDRPGNKRLVAYYTGPEEIEANALRLQLASQLPEHMVPAAYVHLAAWPLTPNAKLDRKALPAPSVRRGTAYLASRTPTEAVLAEIWAEVLRLDPIGVDDDFIELGGHSLSAIQLMIRVRERFNRPLPLKTLFATRTIARFAALLDGAAANEATAPLATLPGDDPSLPVDRAPLSYQQSGVWLLEKLSPDSLAYNAQCVIRIHGEIRQDLLRQSLDDIVSRHEIFRTTFHDDEGAPYQCIHAEASASLRIVDLAGENPAKALSAMVDQEVRRPFTLSALPLVRWTLVRLSEREHALIHVEHHFVHDGWSANLFLDELLALYEYHAGLRPACPPPPAQYRHYANWQRSPAADARYRQQLAFWKEKLRGAPFILPLMTDFPRPPAPSYRGRQARFEFPAGLSERLRRFARAEGVTVYMTLLAAFEVLLGKYCGTDDLLIGSAVANRKTRDAERMLGMFVNSIVIRTDVTGNPTFRELLGKVRDTVVDAYEHEEVPFSQVVRELQPSRSAAHNPLFQVGFSFHNSNLPELAGPGFTLSLFEAYSNHTCKFDFEIVLIPRGTDPDNPDTISLLWNYSTDLFTQDTMDRMRSNYMHLLERCLADPSQRLDALEWVSDRERQQLLVEWNRSDVAYPQDRSLPQLFEVQVIRDPSATALVFEDQTLSYGELNARANRLAHHLQAQGVGPDQLVAICVERSLEMVVGLLAVLKAGGAYVPLDPAYPTERLAYMLGDSAPSVVLTHGAARAALNAALDGLEAAPAVLDLEADAAHWAGLPDTNPQLADLSPQHLAYVIYTSGSTGTPKGVMVEHRNVTRLFDSSAQHFGFGEDDVWTLFHSFAFDFSVWEIWGALLHGGRLVVVPALTARAPDAFYTLLCRERVSVLNQTPSAFRGLIAAQADSTQAHCLRQVIFGGEALDLAMLGPWYRDPRNQATQLVNMYGITETTVHVTYRALTESDAERPGNSPIGRPLDDLRLYLLDAAGAPVPIGVAGELHVGGAGVARGYLNRPELTAARFIASPFVEGDRLYKTGDLGRWLPDGTVEYLGRNDFQVKLRGFRIELGEIEAKLAGCDGVKEAVVLAREDQPGDRRLVAYYTGPAEIAVDALRSQLAATLPEHMVPAAYVHLAAWPLTPNGKLDRKALPAPDAGAYRAREYEAPQGEVETALADIWSSLLGIERVGRHDHFFELGGHSLLAVKVLERMRRQGLHADVRVLFTTPTLAALAAAVGGATDQAEVPANRLDGGPITPAHLPLVTLTQDEIDGIVACVPGGAANVQDIYPLAPLQEGILFHHLMAQQGDPYLLSGLMRFADRAALERYLEALSAVVARHDILRTAVLWERLAEPVQVVWRQAPPVVEEVELDPVEGEIAEQLRRRYDPRRTRLDLRQAPLLRLFVARDPRSGQWLALKLFHHIIDDNTSFKYLKAEIATHLAGQADKLAPPLPYRNYVAQTRRGVSQTEHEAFFGQMLSGVDEPTAPFGLLNVQGDGLEVEQARGELALPLALRLRAQAQQLGVSAASLFHVAWGQVLAHTAGRQEVVFGTVLFGRMQGGEGADRVLGPFINTLPVRIGLGETGAADCVRDTHRLLTGLIRHEHASLVLAQRCSAVQPPMPLFTSLLNYRHSQSLVEEGAQAQYEDEAWMEQLGGHEERSNYPLTLDVDDWGDGFRLTAQASGGVAAQRVCDMMRRALETLVEALEQVPTRPVGRLDVLPPAERQQLLVDWNRTEAAYPQDLCVQQLFEAQVARDPAATALVFEDQSLSYGELNAQANRLAHHLQAQGVGPDRLVAICVERSLEMVVALLAVLKAGGAYVPLDPAYPAERLAHMLRDSAPPVVLTHGPARAALNAALAGVETVPTVLDMDADADRWADRSDANPQVAGLTPQHLAYVIYTSGTTAAAKGVMVEHGQVVAVSGAWRTLYDLRPGLTHLQMASFSFDVFAADVVRSLGFGGRLVLCPSALLLDGAALYRVLQSHRVAFADFVPAVLNPLMAHLRQVGGTLSFMETVICGSDIWTPANARQLRLLCGPKVRNINAYGVTEAAVDSCCFVLGHENLDRFATLPIGRPIPNVRIYLLDEAGEPVPVGVAGEIHIGGAGVARGYLNRPTLTAERFIANPFVAGDRLYKTGDLGRWLADGTIEYLGRNDFQVKIRGFRIELGEIEARLADCEGVRETVVLAREDRPGDKRLVAYYTGAAEIAVDVLRSQLATTLPEHMVPAAYVHLAAWPLTPNGKLDRKQLPAPDASAYQVQDYVVPQGAVETALAEIWASLLGVERVGRQDHFFELGGHSLLAIRLISRIRQALEIEVPPGALFAAPTLADFAKLVVSDGSGVLPPIAAVDRATPLALSFAQQRLWFLSRMEGVSEAYHMPMGLRLHGRLERVALQQALDRLVARHEALRTTFVDQDGEASQRIGPADSGLPLQLHDLSGVPDTDSQLAALQRQEATAPFDLIHGPLIRGRLIRLAPDEHVLLLTLHHIVSDGWSMGILNRELSVLYAAACRGEADPLPPLAIQYADYAAWQRQWLADTSLAKQGAYWRDTLAGAPALLELPSDRPRPAEQDYRGGLVPIALDPALTAGLKALSLRHGCTLFMTLLAGWAVVLSRLSGQPEVVIGTPTANRRRSELEGLIGFFVNTLALRLDLGGAPTLEQLLARTRTAALGAQANQDLPFEQVVEQLNPVRSLAHAPLFQAMFAWQNTEEGEFELPGLRVERVAAPHTIAKFDLTLSLAEVDGRVVGGLDYASALFDAATIERQVGYLHTVLTELVKDAGQTTAAVPLLSEQERQQLLVEWNRSDVAYPQDRSLPQLFEVQVIRDPSATALVFEDQTLSYGELNARANRLAHHLQAQGVGPDQLVAICVERSLEMVVGLLAVLKAGGAYVPLDPAYPTERLAYMLGDSAPSVVLTHGAARAALNAALDGLEAAPAVLDLDADAAHWAGLPDTNPQLAGLTPHHLAYVIYTSGSTGRPKGVAQTRGALHNLIHWQIQHAAPASLLPARVLQFASISFDVSFQEICSTLCQGQTLVLMNEVRRKELGQLRAFLAEQGVRRAFLPAAVLQQITSLGGGDMAPADGCEIVTAGEALQVTDELRACLRNLGGRHLYNQYGPTETHVVSQFTLACAEADAWPALPPIGRPIANARLYVLDDALNPVPVGVLGELYIGGAGLARGYVNRPELTAERFLPDPFSPVAGARMYRSGDRARFLPDGNIEYAGRIDQQVKLRGFRVELGEIESVLQQQPGVREAAVLVREDQPGDRRLVAYLVGEADTATLRERLRQCLPEHMVPTQWMALDRLPLTANGKLDRKALPAPEQLQSDAAYVAPRTELEARMADIWATVLKRDQVGIYDNFFSLGGHSLLATRLVHAVNQQLSAQLSLRDLFRKPVLAELVADLVAKLGREDVDAAAAAFVFDTIEPDWTNRHQPFPLTDIQQAYWVGREATIELGGVGAHGYGELVVRQFDEARFTRALNRLIQRHDMFRAIFLPDGTQQVLEAVPPYRMPRQDLRGLAPAAVEAALSQTRERMSHQLLDASRWPLFEFGLTVLEDELAHLHISMDSLIVDAASSQILERELALLYLDPEAPLPPLALTFRDYVLAEQALRDTPRYDRALRYWRDRLPTLAPAPGLPLARQPETIVRPHFTRRDRVLAADRWDGLKATAKRFAVTPSVLLLTAFAEVLARWSRHPRFTLSLPLFNRLPLHPGVNGVVGDFTSLVLLEVQVEAGASFLQRAQAVQEQLWQDIDHAAVSGVRVIRELSQWRGTRQTAIPVVFNSTLSELSGEAEVISLTEAVRGESIYSITQTPQVWIDHTIMEFDGQLCFNWDSIDELFPDGMIAEMFDAYGDLLDRLHQPAAWQESALRYPPPAGLDVTALPPMPRMHELFDRQALATPAALAVVGADRQFSYQELRRHARRLGGRLQARGVVPNRLVAVMMERGWEQVLGTLAILYAGGAYLPIDPTLPPERVRHILERAEVDLVLTQSALQGRIDLPETVASLAVDREVDAGAEDDATLQPVALAETDLAYVIYTSGSTGLPKGVVIDHRGAVNTLLDINARFDVGPRDRVLAISSLSFDLSVFDLFGTLAAGGAVVMLSTELARDPVHWLDLIRAHRVSIWNSVPALLGMLVEYAEGSGQPLPATLRLAMLSGDWIPLSLPPKLHALLPDTRLISLGGATEASIWSIWYPVERVEPSWRSIPYGKALKNQRFYVLDEAMQERPAWVPGQLYIGGIGLAQGYWRDEARTGASFFDHPQTGERLYRTGDLGRTLPDGNIEFLGREDGQVKVQGYRVELGEVESALERHPAVEAAVARVWGAAQEEKRLAAYLVVRGDVDTAEVARFLAGTLPSYMVPTSFTVLDQLPLSANGKVDRGRLPEPVREVEADGVTLTLDDPREQRIVEIVAGILKQARIAHGANLLNLGATSIDIVRISNALSSELGFRPRLAQLMARPTLADLIGLYRGEAAQRDAAPTPAVTAEPEPDGVIEDPQARQAFKARQPGRRRFGADAAGAALAQPADADFARRFAELRSVRCFDPQPIAAQAFADLLACLSQGTLDGQPKYLYPSAGSLYPVQTYLYLKPGRVAGVPGGAYYHDPVTHRLIEIGQGRVLPADAYDYFVNRPVFEGAAFAVFLMAELAAIRPLYGEKSLDFCHIEAGAMAQLLAGAAADQQLGLCGVGMVEVEPLRALFDLGDSHRLIYSMVGGLRADEKRDARLVEAFIPTRDTAADEEDMEQIEI